MTTRSPEMESELPFTLALEAALRDLLQRTNPPPSYRDLALACWEVVEKFRPVRGSIDDLIAASSLGTPGAMAVRGKVVEEAREAAWEAWRVHLDGCVTCQSVDWCLDGDLLLTEYRAARHGPPEGSR